MPQVTLEQAIAVALEHYNAGRLIEAESICRQILAADGNYLDALHLLGVIAMQTNNLPTAIELLLRAVSIAPNRSDIHNSLGLALTAAGKFNDAIASFETALSLEPDLAPARNNLGKALHANGQIDDAIAAFRKAIDLRPDLVEAHINLGGALKQTGKRDESISAYRAAVIAGPNIAVAHLGLGNALRAVDRNDEAIASFRAALAIDPRLTKALNNLGNALAAQGNVDSAITLYRQALAIDPHLAAAWINLGAAYQDQADYQQAIDAFRAAIRFDPNSVDAHYNLATCLGHAQQRSASLEEFRIAQRLAPDNADIQYRIGLTLYELSRTDEAIEHLRATIAAHPDQAPSYNTLGIALKDRGELTEALECFRKAIAIRPDYVAAGNNLIYSMHFEPRFDMHAIRAEQDRWSHTHAEPLKKFIRPHDNARDENRRLKIGYVSPNFRHQAEANFVLPLLEAHDHDAFEIHCYSDVKRTDNVTAGMQRLADAWYDVHRLKDHELAEKIRADQIDILVDLTMQMADDRMLALAEKPAPIQVAYLAYPGSSGLATMDLRITDHFMDPPEADDSWATEHALRLPDSWCVYHPVTQYPDVNDLPALANGHITFGSLNNFCKANEHVLARWANVLNAIGRSRLILLCPPGDARRRVIAFFKQRGIAEERLDFVFLLPRPEYLQTYLRIDIALDPFPYNGITTTCDALWMGVPVLTLPGTTPPSRAGLSVLNAAGHPEFVANSEDHYITLARELAGRLDRLKAYRSTMRQRMQKSLLMDKSRFARNVEAAYQNVWKQWCARPV